MKNMGRYVTAATVDRTENYASPCWQQGRSRKRQTGRRTLTHSASGTFPLRLCALTAMPDRRWPTRRAPAERAPPTPPPPEMAADRSQGEAAPRSLVPDETFTSWWPTHSSVTRTRVALFRRLPRSNRVFAIYANRSMSSQRIRDASRRQLSNPYRCRFDQVRFSSDRFSRYWRLICPFNVSRLRLSSSGRVRRRFVELSFEP